MVTETAKLMKEVYDELCSKAAELGEIDGEQEARLRAEIEIKFGIGRTKAAHAIENMVMTGRIKRGRGERVQ